jgi:transposase
MTQFARPTPAAADYDSTIIGALELSEKKWVLAVQLPGVQRHSRHVVEARGDELAAFVERLKARCAVAGHNIKRVILTHEAGRDGFWLARFLVRRGVEVHVMQPSSLPVDRRARRAKTDVIDVEMLLRTLMAWTGAGVSAESGLVRPRSSGSVCVLQCPSPKLDHGQAQRGALRSCSTGDGFSREGR